MVYNSLHLCLRQIHVALIKTKRNRKVVQQYSDFLVAGYYRNSLAYDNVYKTQSHKRINSSTFSSHNEKLGVIAKIALKLLNFLFVYRVSHNLNRPVFEGTELIISSSLTEYKFFDLHKAKVLTVFKSKEKLIDIIAAKERFTPYYNIPKTIFISEDQLCLVEEFIKHKDYDVDTVFNVLCESICNLLNNSATELTINVAKYEKACNYFESRFHEFKLDYETIGGIMAYTHGDLWSSNIIFDGSKVYLTDFEHCGERFFLYDFFMFIFTEWHLKNDDCLIVNYFNGRYDNILSRMFNAVNEKYDENRRSNYFMVFIVSILYDRWFEYEAIEIIIKDFITKYIHVQQL